MSDDAARLRRPPVTAEEMDLLATPDEELKKRTQVFSFETDRFDARISTGDRWQQLLQGHLYFDHVVSRLLSEALENPDALNLARMGFRQKLQLSRAMGLVPAELAPAVESLNALRNRIAHDLNFEISDEDERTVANCTPKWLREILITENGRMDGPVRLHELIRGLVYQLDIYRQRHAFSRLTMRKSEIHLRTVLDRTQGAVYRP